MLYHTKHIRKTEHERMKNFGDMATSTINRIVETSHQATTNDMDRLEKEYRFAFAELTWSWEHFCKARKRITEK